MSLESASDADVFFSCHFCTIFYKRKVPKVSMKRELRIFRLVFVYFAYSSSLIKETMTQTIANLWELGFVFVSCMDPFGDGHQMQLHSS